MTSWTLSDIRQKVRKVTGRLSSEEISNNELDDYINKYFKFTFPAELKTERNHVYYEFLTEENQHVYSLPSGYTNFEPPATMDGQQLLWYQEPSQFFEYNPEQYSRTTPWTGDGSTTNFTQTSDTFPILPDTLVITDETEVFEDTNTTFSNSPVTITGSEGGTATVNYETGAISVTFNTAPDDGQNISLSYVKFIAGRPTAVLLYNNQFRFFNVPDTAYRFRVKAYRTVTELTDATDTPELDQWGPCIAYGASRDLVADFGEMDAYAEITALYKEQLAYVMRRTNQNLLNQRAMPKF